MGPIFYVFVRFYFIYYLLCFYPQWDSTYLQRLTPQGFVFDLPKGFVFDLPLCGSLSLTTWDHLLP